MKKDNKIKQDDRKTFVLNSLRRNDSVSVPELADKFGVAQMTIRRDLLELERKGFVVRRYGGAVKAGSADPLFSFSERFGVRKTEKKSIGVKAASLVRDGDTLFIDCGTTPFQVCVHLRDHKNLKVITNSLPVAAELIRHPSAKVLFIGGEIISERQATCGRLAEKALGEYRADRAFIGADGVSISGGLSAYDEREGQVSLRMARQSREAWLVCDSSKMEKDSFFRYSPISLIHGIVTDSGLAPSLRKQYEDAGISVQLA